MRWAVLIILGWSALLGACGGRVPPRPAGAPDAAAVGWVIMAGDRENPDQQYVCQSSPRDECVIPVSRPDRAVHAHVHLYFHPAAVDARYTGAIQIGFFNRPAEIKPDVAVEGRGSVGNHSVTGIVTDAPGQYAITIDVTATPAASGSTQQIREQVPVLVK
jgi:hypothetical protein